MDSLIEKIQKLKKERNAVILAHNYQLSEVQDIADFTGDSLDLSRRAAQSDAAVIVFCGVHFMAETAAILAPGKKVLLPEKNAGCPMADMITAAKLRELKKENPGALVVSYVNTTAEVKAETDICCTSANAEKILRTLSGRKVIFVPDRNLGSYASSKAGCEMIIYDGYCHVHSRILAQHIKDAKHKHPKAEVVAHPECNPDVSALADKVLSTSGMLEYAASSKSSEMIIATETGILHRLRKENPLKKFYPALELAVCSNMKKTSLEKVLWALEEMRYEIKVDPVIAEKAKISIDKMLEYSRSE